MSWRKDGIDFVPPLVVNGIAWRQPSDDMLIAAGYVWEEPPITAKDYDDALEAHLLAERNARGYTKREPDANAYYEGDNERWAQDARDWVEHVQAVMEYGLEVQNKAAAGEPVPTLPEFIEALPKIQWTLALP